VLVTNAHRKSLNLKMDRTGLALHFDAMHVSHEYGIAKEDPAFWAALQSAASRSIAERTLLVDDSLPVLRSARQFGHVRLYSPILRPDTRISPTRMWPILPPFAASAKLRPEKLG
jgi:FMN phosphatase YigB (HAD superfamily)